MARTTHNFINPHGRVCISCNTYKSREEFPVHYAGIHEDCMVCRNEEKRKARENKKKQKLQRIENEKKRVIDMNIKTRDIGSSEKAKTNIQLSIVHTANNNTKCVVCDTLKDPSEFHKTNKSRCKACVYIRNKATMHEDAIKRKIRTDANAERIRTAIELAELTTEQRKRRERGILPPPRPEEHIEYTGPKTKRDVQEGAYMIPGLFSKQYRK